MLKQEFPMLKQTMNDKPLVYLDSGATTLKPQGVIDAMSDFYSNQYATVHRGVYEISHISTERYDTVRKQVQSFIHAKSDEEIVFVKGTTEAINLVAMSYGQPFLRPDQNIVITEMEHHANLIPWQQLCKRVGAELRIAPITDDGELILDKLESLIDDKTFLVAVTHVSNVLGTINPIKKIIELAHTKSAKVLIDGAQAVAHCQVDVQKLDCDFYCFSGHKMYGPTGIGILYGKKKILQKMTPYQFGGDMIESVDFQDTTFAEPPLKFEAGTPPFVEVIGLGAAISFIENIGLENIAMHENELLIYATQELQKIEGLKIFGTAKKKSAVISFEIPAAHSHDVGSILDADGVAIRVGHHCAQPLMKRLGVPATTRASFCLFNTKEEIDKLISGIKKTISIFS